MLCVIFFQVVKGKPLENRLNYGTVFKPMPDMYSTSEHWKHTFIIDLKLNVFQDDAFPKCNCTEFISVARHLSDIHNDTFAYISTVTKHILNIIPNVRKPFSRNRRSLLPFVGKIASGLFGLATASDVQKIADNLNALHRNNRKLDAVFEHRAAKMSSFMLASNERLSNAFKGIRENHEMIEHMELNFESFAETFAEKQSWLFTKIIDQTYNYNMIRQNYQNLFIGFNNLLQGQLSPLIIDRSQLNKALDLINYSILKHRPNFKLLHKSPAFYYTHSDFALHKSDHALLITVKFPISSQAQPFNLFEVINFPVPVNNSVLHATAIKGLPSYIAFNGEYYISLSSEIINDCDKSKTLVNCHVNFPLKPLSKPDCAMSIFTSNKTSTKANCNFEYVPNALRTTFRQLNQTHFLAVNNSHTSITCKDNSYSLAKCHFCLIQIPCNCTVQTDEFAIPERHTDCHFNQGFTTLHPVNLILLQHFFDEKAIADIHPNSTYSEPLNITLKHFKIYEHEFQSVIANDDQVNLNLQKVIASAKEDSIIYSNLAEPYLDNFSTYQDNSYSLAIILSSISLTFTIVLILALFLIYKKYSRILAPIIASQIVQNTSAANLPSFHYTQKTEILTSTAKSPIEHFHTHFMDFNEYALLFLVIIILVFVVIRKFRSFKRPQLYIEISNDEHSVFFPVMSLPRFVQNCKFIGDPTKLQMDISCNGISPAVKVNWSHMYIKTSDLAEAEFPPNSVKVDIITAYRLRKLLIGKSRTTIQLWIEHNNFCIPIDILSETPPSAPAPIDNGDMETKPLYPTLS